MAIYLDTNALPWIGGLDGPELSAVRAVASELGQELVLPALVAEESAANRMRETEKALGAIRKSFRDAGWIPGLEQPPLPEPAQLASAWRGQLDKLFIQLPTSGSNALEALRREINRIPPTKEGRGARDAVVWLAVRDDHLSRREPGYFVSRNTADFADRNGGRLHPELAREVQDHAYELYYLSDPDQLMDLIATSTTDLLTLDDLRHDERLRNAVAARAEEVMPSHEALGEMLLPKLDFDDSGSQSSIITAGGIDKVELNSIARMRTHTFKKSRAVVVFNSEWLVDFPVDVSRGRSRSGEVSAKGVIRQKYVVQAWGLTRGAGRPFDWEVSNIKPITALEIVSPGVRG